MKTLLALVFAAWTSFALAQPPAAELPKPGTKDLCPVCGMLTAKYPNWVATIVYKDGLRYPHLERIPNTPDRLADILKARK